MTQFFDATTDGKNITTTTEFKSVVENSTDIRETHEDEFLPEQFDHVTMIIKNDASYGDVFLAWNKGEEDDKMIFFGKAGNEFNNDKKQPHGSIH